MTLVDWANVTRRAARHRYGLSLVALLAASVAAGMAVVVFMRMFELAWEWRASFDRIGLWAFLLAPVVILVVTEATRRWAPAAAGTGIPQTIFAARRLTPATEDRLRSLYSPQTLAAKVACLLIAVWVGASTGREGPSVHVGMCVFMLVVLPLRRWLGLDIDGRSAAVAGGAAGLAAAFNTPLAGVTFAVEELVTDFFASVKDSVMLSIVVAGVAAQYLYGEFAYFGRLRQPPPVHMGAVLLIGVGCGALGVAFGVALLRGQDVAGRLRARRRGWLVPVLLACVVVACGWLAGSDVFGAGNGVAQRLTRGDGFSGPLFPFAKATATLCTYWAGVAGGIFAPSLSMGASAGATLGAWAGAPASSAAMVGMAAFLSGAIQAPITSFVIIFEMTGHHEIILPVMLGALLGFMIARLVRAPHLYQKLAEVYEPLMQGPGGASIDGVGPSPSGPGH